MRRAELEQARDLAAELGDNVHYSVKGSRVTISRGQVARIERLTGRALTDAQREDLRNALRARRTHRGSDYLVKMRSGVKAGPHVEILDNANGYTRSGQRWTAGLHEAIEVKEKLPAGRASTRSPAGRWPSTCAATRLWRA